METIGIVGQQEYRRAQAQITAERAAMVRKVAAAPKVQRRPTHELYSRRKAREDRFTRRLLIGAMVLCALATCAIVGWAWIDYTAACSV